MKTTYMKTINIILSFVIQITYTPTLIL